MSRSDLARVDRPFDTGQQQGLQEGDGDTHENEGDVEGRRVWRVHGTLHAASGARDAAAALRLIGTRGCAPNVD